MSDPLPWKVRYRLEMYDGLGDLSQDDVYTALQVIDNLTEQILHTAVAVAKDQAEIDELREEVAYLKRIAFSTTGITPVYEMQTIADFVEGDS